VAVGQFSSSYCYSLSKETNLTPLFSFSSLLKEIPVFPGNWVRETTPTNPGRFVGIVPWNSDWNGTTAKQSDNRTSKEKIKVEIEDKKPSKWVGVCGRITSRLTIGNLIMGYHGWSSPGS